MYLTDGTGTDSVQNVIASHSEEITAIEVESYEHWSEHTEEIMDNLTPNDVVILDTMTMFAEMTRTDLKIGNDPKQLNWAMRNKFFDHKNNWDYYDAATNYIMRRLKNMKNKGARIIVTAHERTDEDLTTTPPTKRRVPDLNQKLATSLIASSSVVARLRVIYENEYKGEAIKYKKGQRLLEMGQSLEFAGKIHAPIEVALGLPTTISRPSLPKLYKALGFKPTWLTVYGPPGSGKSTFSLSEFLDMDGSGIGL